MKTRRSQSKNSINRINQSQSKTNRLIDYRLIKSIEGQSIIYIFFLIEFDYLRLHRLIRKSNLSIVSQSQLKIFDWLRLHRLIRKSNLSIFYQIQFKIFDWLRLNRLIRKILLRLVSITFQKNAVFFLDTFPASHAGPSLSRGTGIPGPSILGPSQFMGGDDRSFLLRITKFHKKFVRQPSTGRLSSRQAKKPVYNRHSNRIIIWHQSSNKNKSPRNKTRNR